METIQYLTSVLRPCGARICYEKSADDKMFANAYGKRGKGAIPNPFKGRITIIACVSGVIGTSYLNSVTNCAIRSGATSDVKVELKETWHKVYNKFFNIDKATEKKFYLKLQQSEKQKDIFGNDTYEWLLDGKPLSKEDAEALKPFLKPIKENKMSSTQVEAGVSADNEQHYTLISLENIKSITQNGFYWERG